MKKINRKGYMLVEIIVSFALAFTVLIYLTNLLLKYKDINEDLFYSTKYIKDKNLITRNIMDDLTGASIAKPQFISPTPSGEDGTKFGVIFFYVPNEYFSEDATEAEKTVGRRKFEIIKEDGILKIKYGSIIENASGGFDYNFDDNTYYQKILEPSLNVDFDNIKIKDENGIFSLSIPIKSIYTNELYDINIFSKRVYIFDLNMAEGLKEYYNGVCLMEGSTTVLNGCRSSLDRPLFKVNLVIGEETEMLVNDRYVYLKYNTPIRINYIDTYTKTLTLKEHCETENVCKFNFEGINKDIGIYLEVDLSNIKLLGRRDWYNWHGKNPKTSFYGIDGSYNDETTTNSYLYLPYLID